MLTHHGIPLLHWTIQKVEEFHDWLVEFVYALTAE